MLLDGFNHVAILTKDSERLHAFYREVFDATVDGELGVFDGMRISLKQLMSRHMLENGGEAGLGMPPITV